MIVISTDTVRTGLERADRSSKVRKAGIVISVLVTTADTDAHRQPATAEHVAGRQLLREHDGVV